MSYSILRNTLIIFYVLFFITFLWSSNVFIPLSLLLSLTLSLFLPLSRIFKNRQVIGKKNSLQGKERRPWNAQHCQCWLFKTRFLWKTRCSFFYGITEDLSGQCYVTRVKFWFFFIFWRRLSFRAEIFQREFCAFFN